MTELNTEALQNVMTSKKRNAFLTDEVRDTIHVMVNKERPIGEIVTALKKLTGREDIKYQYVYNYLSRVKKALAK